MAKDKEFEQGLLDEIDAAVDTANNDIIEDESGGESPVESEDKGGNSGDALPEKESATGDDEGGEEDAGGEDPGITDVLLERAVKAGFPLAEAKLFPNAKALETILSRMEGTDGNDAGDAGRPAASDNDEVDRLDIPDLDPDDYDDKIVAGFKAMKGMIERQQQVIDELKSETGRSTGEWFDGQVDDLAPEFKKALESNQERRETLRKKFDVLSAGYKAAGESVGKSTIFDEAVAMTLGDVAVKAAERAKGEALRKRGAQHIARPSGNRVAPAGDAFDDVAKELDNKFFERK